MRVLNVALPALLLLAMTGCAPTMGGDRYTAELKTLTDQCSARGGILSPTGEQTGRPQTDYICKITGGGGRLTTGG
ncbi:hypothetical protein [Brevundimonas sp. TWP2-3-4b2]|uniref:hypothetical protein n=1 Tax=Brevundimonas sp. TWP2-3-4b2 TaxID=2804595 RepID=UPI003CF6611D